ncbi:hypothetical protein Tco_1367718 [Tanacetum coccineum]
MIHKEKQKWNVNDDRPHGRMILASVEKGPLVWPSITEDGVTRLKEYVELTPAEAIQADCDIKAINIILQGLPTEIYALVSQHRVAKDLWEKIKLLMQGTSLTKQERECKLYDEFDKFHLQDRRDAHEYYLRFISKPINSKPLSSHLHTHPKSLSQLHVSPYQSSQFVPPYQTQQFTTNQSTPLSITYPSNEYQSTVHHNVYSSQPSIPQVEYAPTAYQQQQPEFSQSDSGLVVPVFQKGDDPIDAINHMMSFLTAVVTSRYPTTNNQLRTSSNPRQQATIYDGKVTVQPVQGRQTTYAAGTTRKYTPGASGSNTRKQRNCLVNTPPMLLIKSDDLDAYTLIEMTQNSAKDWLSCESLQEWHRCTHCGTLIPIIHDPMNYLIKLKELKRYLTGFDLVIKERTTATTITEGTWGFEHTKACFRDEIIPFIKELKDIFNNFNQYLVEELADVQKVFYQMEQAVEQHRLESRTFEVKINQVLSENERLLAQAINSDIVKTVVNLSVNEGCETVNECQKCLELKTEPLNKKDFVDKETYDKLYLKGNVDDSKVKMDMDEIETLNIELEHRVTKLVAENEHLKQTYKQLYDSIKPKRVQSKEQCDALIKQVNIKSGEISDLNAKLQEQGLVIAALKNELRKLKGKAVDKEAIETHSVDPNMSKDNMEPITPKLLNKRTAHSSYIKHTQEEAWSLGR